MVSAAASRHWVVCAACGRGFYSATSDEEALREARETFPAEALEEELREGPLPAVCDPCWTAFLEWAKKNAPEVRQPRAPGGGRP